jgi:glycosyltransferase involved in cell wall biosynthesis
VLYVGTLLNRRHIPDLLQGFAVAQTRVPGARLVLVGANRTHPRLDVGALAARLGIAGRVDWRGYVSEAELDRLYSSARVFAFLSDYEGFAMTPMEALARGTPAVMLDTPVTREVYGDGARRVQATPDEIGESLALLLVDDAAHAAVLAAGQARLRDLSWGRTAATILRALEEAAGSR